MPAQHLVQAQERPCADVERTSHVFEILGAAFLCGFGDPLSLLSGLRVSGQCLSGCGQDWRVGVLRLRSSAWSFNAALSPPPVTEPQRADCQHPRLVMKAE